MQREDVSVRVGWICMLVVSVGILAFGVVVALVPVAGDVLLYRADGLADLRLGQALDPQLLGEFLHPTGRDAE